MSALLKRRPRDAERSCSRSSRLPPPSTDREAMIESLALILACADIVAGLTPGREPEDGQTYPRGVAAALEALRDAADPLRRRLL